MPTQPKWNPADTNLDAIPLKTILNLAIKVVLFSKSYRQNVPSIKYFLNVSCKHVWHRSRAAGQLLLLRLCLYDCWNFWPQQDAASRKVVCASPPIRTPWRKSDNVVTKSSVNHSWWIGRSMTDIALNNVEYGRNPGMHCDQSPLYNGFLVLIFCVGKL